MDNTQLASLALIRRYCRDGTARTVRVEAGLSVRELASAAGVSFAAISKWERNLAIPRAEGGLRYAESIAELLMNLDEEVGE